MTSWLVVIPSADTYQGMGKKEGTAKGHGKAIHVMFLPNPGLFMSMFRSLNSFRWNLFVGNDIRI